MATYKSDIVTTSGRLNEPVYPGGNIIFRIGRVTLDAAFAQSDTAQMVPIHAGEYFLSGTLYIPSFITGTTLASDIHVGDTTDADRYGTYTSLEGDVMEVGGCISIPEDTVVAEQTKAPYRYTSNDIITLTFPDLNGTVANDGVITLVALIGRSRAF